MTRIAIEGSGFVQNGRILSFNLEVANTSNNWHQIQSEGVLRVYIYFSFRNTFYSINF